MVNLDNRLLSRICPFQPGTGKLGPWAFQTLYDMPSPSPSKHGLFYLFYSLLTPHPPPPPTPSYLACSLNSTLGNIGSLVLTLSVPRTHVSIIWLILILSTYPYSSRPTPLPPGVYLAIVNQTGEPTHPRPHSQAAGSNPDTPSSVLWTPSGYRGRVRDGPEVRLPISRDWHFLPAQSPGATGNRAQRK